MRIVVPIKQVPETNAVRMDEETGTMIREGVEAIVNPLDLYAIEAALSIREGWHGGECEVWAVSMGPPKAAAALREAIAMGIDAGVLICDRTFAGSDTWATSCVLAAAIRKLGAKGETPVPPPVPRLPDLIICGERATDGDTGQVGPGIAAFLDLPVVSYVSRVDEVMDGVCRVHRLVEDGYEVLEVETPAVLTVVKEVADPRLPTLRGKQKARIAEIPAWGAADLDMDTDLVGLSGSPTRVVRIFRPAIARECEKLAPADDHALEHAVDRLVAFLRRKDLL